MDTDPFPNLDLSCLTDRQREVIEMHYDCCCSERAIAEFLGISRRTVRTHHRRALDVLADALSPTSHIR